MQYEEYETEKRSFEFLSMGQRKLRFYVETSEILNELDVNVQCEMQYEWYETEKCSFFRISLDGTNEIYVFVVFYVEVSKFSVNSVGGSNVRYNMKSVR